MGECVVVGVLILKGGFKWEVVGGGDYKKIFYFKSRKWQKIAKWMSWGEFET